MIRIDTAYHWLHRNNRSAQRRSTQILVSQMWEHVDAGAFREVIALQNRIEKIARQSPDEWELAEVLVECGLALFVLGRWEEAANKFLGAIYRYGFDVYHRAVVQWIYGYTLWFLPGKEDEAILAWQECMDKFEHLASRKLLPKGEGEWFREQLEEMSDTMEFTLRALNETSGYPLDPGFGPAVITSRGLLNLWNEPLDLPG